MTPAMSPPAIPDPSARHASPVRDAAPEEKAKHAPAPDAAATMSAGESGHWLLWLTGAAALALGAVALALWGTRGSAVLLDLLIALCA